MTRTVSIGFFFLAQELVDWVSTPLQLIPVSCMTVYFLDLVSHVPPLVYTKNS